MRARWNLPGWRSIPSRLAALVIRIYQVALSPSKVFIFGSTGSCRFHPTCSTYAITALRRHGLLVGGLLTLKRLFRCHPFGPCGFDPVPPRKSETE